MRMKKKIGLRTMKLDFQQKSGMMMKWYTESRKRMKKLALSRSFYPVEAKEIAKLKGKDIFSSGKGKGKRQRWWFSSDSDSVQPKTHVRIEQTDISPHHSPFQQEQRGQP